MLIYFECERLCAGLWVLVCITEAVEEAEGEGADEVEVKLGGRGQTEPSRRPRGGQR